MIALEWSKVAPRHGTDLPTETIFTESAPLSDVCVSEDGDLAFLRRQPGRADVFYWEGYPRGKPVLWRIEDAPGILEVIGVTEKRLLCRGYQELFLLTKDGAQLLNRGGLIHAASWSRDGSKAAWIEERGGRKCYVLDLGNTVPRQLRSVSEPALAVWSAEDELFTCGESRTGSSITTRLARVTLTGLEEVLLETPTTITRIAADPKTGRRAWSGPGISPTEGSKADRKPGVWLGQGAEASCISNGLPTSNLMVVEDGCLFATQFDGRCGFMWATREGARFAATEESVSAFDIDRRATNAFYVIPGRSGAIRQVSLSGLMA